MSLGRSAQSSELFIQERKKIGTEKKSSQNYAEPAGVGQRCVQGLDGRTSGGALVPSVKTISQLLLKSQFKQQSLASVNASAKTCLRCVPTALGTGVPVCAPGYLMTHACSLEHTRLLAHH